MGRVLPPGGNTGNSTATKPATVAATAAPKSQAAIYGATATPAADEPRSNLPFDPRIMRRQFWDGAQNVTSGVISNDVPNWSDPDGLFYCFFLFNPAEIDGNYGFDTTNGGQLPIGMLNPASGVGGGVLTQTVSFNLLFDRTYEVWNGPQHLPASAWYGFGQGKAQYPKKEGPYRFGVLWDVWALERLCGLYRQVDGVPPQGPPKVSPLHVQTGGVNVANTMFGAGTGHQGAANQVTQITVDPTPTSVDFYGYMTQFSVQYTRFDTNMVPTRCAVSLGFQLVYALSAPNASATDGTGGTGGTGG